MTRSITFLFIGLFCRQGASLQSHPHRAHHVTASKSANPHALQNDSLEDSTQTEIDLDTQPSSPSLLLGRDQFFAQASSLTGAAFMGLLSTPDSVHAAEEEEGIKVFQTKSGLKYLELQEGTGPTPRYGQLCAIQYTGYLKLPTESKPQKFDSAAFLMKHGNGRIIAGLDEGIHTMKVGGKRRLIIPPKLGYVQSGLGPLPEMPWNRWSLNKLLSKMVEQRGGNLVFEVELKSVIDDEADQGYYEDESPTPEELQRLSGFQGRAMAPVEEESG